MCGLHLDAIAANILEQDPSSEIAVLFNRKKRAQTLGMISLSTAGVIALMIVLSRVFYYKLLIFGPELLFGSAFAALVVFSLISAFFFFVYPKLFIKTGLPGSLSDRQDVAAAPTNKLLNDPPFEPASVTEHSTELLRRR
jgi:hypothetical protein